MLTRSELFVLPSRSELPELPMETFILSPLCRMS